MVAGAVGGHRRQIGIGLRAGGGPGAEVLLDGGARLFRGDPADHDNGREIGPEGRGMEGAHLLDA